MARSNLSSGVVLLQKVSKGKLTQARMMRSSPTPAENRLWQYLRRNRVAGFKFRRQQLIEGYIADFFCHAAKLIIEVDGSIHDTTEQKETDTHRRAVFAARGLLELRFSNSEILNDIENVIEKITSVTKNRSKSA